MKSVPMSRPDTGAAGSFHHSRRWLALLAVITLALLTVAFFGGLEQLVQRWSSYEEYSHGFFVPPIVLWLLWRQRRSIVPIFGDASWLAVPAILLAILFLLTGEYSALFILIQAGFVLGLMAIVLATGGLNFMKIAAVPMFMLILTIPLPYFLEAELSARLQLLSTTLGSAVLDLLNIPVYTQGNLIDLGDFRLQIQDACSGLRYLYPLLSIGFIFAYLYQASFWRRGVLFLSAIPISILMNVIRIAGTGILVNLWGPAMAEGFLHEFAGWLIFMLCLLIMAGEIKLLEQTGRKRSLGESLSLPEPAHHPDKAGLVRYRPLLVVAFMTAFAILADHHMTHRQEYVPPHLPLDSFPLQLGNWQAQHPDDINHASELIGTGDYLMANYRENNGTPVNLFLSYYPSQSKGVSPHSPEVCMPGNGWIMSSPTVMHLAMPDGHTLSLLRATISRSNEQQLMYYWFDERGRDLTNAYLMKWYLIRDAILTHRSDGGMVRLITPILNTELPDKADQRLQSFLHTIYPVLGAYIPDSSATASDNQ